MNNNQLKSLAVTALFAAIICAISPFGISIGSIPITFATLGVYLAGTVLGPKKGTISVAVYLTLGALGVPVFASFSGGLASFVGVTGGYLVGYLPCAFLSGLIPALAKGKRYSFFLGTLLGTAVCYSVGTAWFMFEAKAHLSSAFTVCILPFLPGDAAKIVLASLWAPKIKELIPA